MPLLDDDALERSDVVANRTMNRERTLRGYRRELGLDIAAELAARAPARWLDLCCGTGRALYEAAMLPGVEITGVDLTGHFVPPPWPRNLRLVTASVSSWTPDAPFDLVTSVHGVHYLGDKLGVLARAASWLAEGGLLVANFDARSVRLEDGSPAGRRLSAELRRQGLDYDASRRRVRATGPTAPRLPYRYLGADDGAGPNYTGQPAVHSYYTPVSAR